AEMIASSSFAGSLVMKHSTRPDPSPPRKHEDRTRTGHSERHIGHHAFPERTPTTLAIHRAASHPHSPFWHPASRP
ncbi:hypothetical protein, partial [Burkholderia sp. Ac-20392]|uniref:hypothetical protein n=1 Tax=Burkholderia sp. Ac-20392 TaxID=2703905 RepID=UPI001980E848